MRKPLAFCITYLLLSLPAFATTPKELYDQLRAFTLDAKSKRVDALVLQEERLTIEFTGDFTPARSIDGQIYGAVFRGIGRVQMTPWSTFEKDSAKRFLKVETVDVNFTSAVLRFSDDTAQKLELSSAGAGQLASSNQQLASGLEERADRETGLNISSRLADSVSNHQTPGIFFAEFDGGKVGRFGVLVDRQSRGLADAFGLNAGEKCAIFQYRGSGGGNDIWTASYGESDFKTGHVTYSDVFDLVHVDRYRMNIDLRELGRWMRSTVEMDLTGLQSGVQWVPFSLNEELPEWENMRLKKSIRVTKVSLLDGTELPFVQSAWQKGFAVQLPKPLDKGEKVQLRILTQAEHGFNEWEASGYVGQSFYYPISQDSWYPRHGYLQRSQFDLTFQHKAKTSVVSVGEHPSENQPVEKYWVTKWLAETPVPFVSYAVGPFERHTETMDVSGRKLPIEFYSFPGKFMAVKEDFILAELMNGVNVFSTLYGDYPYSRLGAAFFPSNYGVGLPSMLLLPAQGRSGINDFAFIAHEGSHQWWGNKVTWRSYRDQWLSEGFAEYSAALYASRRKDPKEALELIKRMRRELDLPPVTETGLAGGKLWQVGPLIMGSRLSTRMTGGAYTALTYAKGALVLRMVHFLLSNPATGEDQAFFDMMKDFINRNQQAPATTEGFFAVASEYFANSPIGKKFGLKDLNWFMKQWVYQAEMPSYTLNYSLQTGPKGESLLTGTVEQEGVGEKWFMPLPITIEFDNHQVARGVISAYGPRNEIKVMLPPGARNVRLDPSFWVLADKMQEKRR